ncbi:MAG: hypothetical protein NT172_18260 [Planctomycetota bacterium]|nr:hypothetical protein [Planctomycetota bacterium]
MNSNFRCITGLLAIALCITVCQTKAKGVDLYVGSAGNSIYKIDSGGVVSPFVTGLGFPSVIASDRLSTLYSTDYKPNGESYLFKYDKNGDPTLITTGLNGPYTQAMAIDFIGNVYLSNNGDNSIRKVDVTGKQTYFATTVTNPKGLAFDEFGYLYAINSSDWITKFDSAGNIAIGYKLGYLLDLRGITFDSLGNLFATSFQNKSVIKMDRLGNVSTYKTGLDSPAGLVFDDIGNLYVANTDNGTISKINPNGLVSTFATGFDHPYSLAIPVPEPSTYALTAVATVIMAYLAKYRKFLCNQKMQ